MVVAWRDGRIALDGACGLQDAETLLSLLQERPGSCVDVGRTTHLHAAVWQVILAMQPPVEGRAPDPFVRRWLLQESATGGAPRGEAPAGTPSGTTS